MIQFALVCSLIQTAQPAPVVAISAADIAQAARLTIDPAAVWRIGGEAEGPYSFARIIGAVFMRNGNVALLESNPPEVRLYDQTGRHAKSFGRRGRGPGEFANLRMGEWGLTSFRRWPIHQARAFFQRL